MNKRRGRPPGRSDTKDRIVRAARARFVELGYRATTIRAIAADAGVDAALIAYHFGSKRGLFVESLDMAFSPAEVLDAAIDGPEPDLPGRLLDTVMNIWEDPERGPAMRTFAVEALQHAEVLAAFREYMEVEVRTRAAEMLQGARVDTRANAALMLAMGLVFSRYLIAIPSAAQASRDEIRATLLPMLQLALNPPQRPRRGPAR